MMNGKLLWEFSFANELGRVVKEPIAWLRLMPVTGGPTALLSFAVSLPVMAVVIVVACVVATIVTPPLLASLVFRALVLDQTWDVPS